MRSRAGVRSRHSPILKWSATESTDRRGYADAYMPVMMTHFAMLQRNLLYTGVTRAKRVLVLVGQKKAVGYCVRNVTVDKRNTLLAERLAGALDKPAQSKGPPTMAP